MAGSVLYTKEEDDLLRKLCKEGVTAGEISRQLPGRTERSVMHRCVYLNLKTGKAERNWTEAEILTLEKGLKEDMPVLTLAKLLPKRSLHGMFAVARKMGFPSAAIHRQISINRGETKENPRKKPQGRDVSMRKCMACGKKFHSWGIGNRLCDEHRRVSTGIDL